MTLALAASGTTVPSAAERLAVSPYYLYRLGAGDFPPSPRILRGLASLLQIAEARVLLLCPTQPGEKPLPRCDRAIEELRTLGLTNRALAQQAGLGPHIVSTYLTGARRPTPKFLSAIEDATGMPREQLFPHLFAVDDANG